MRDHEGKILSRGKTYNQDHMKPARPEYDLEALLETYQTQVVGINERDAHVFLLDLVDEEKEVSRLDGAQEQSVLVVASL